MRARGEGTIVLRSDGRWAGRLHLGYENGRRLTKWVYSRVSAEDCAARLADERARLRRGMQPSNERWTMNDQAASWLVNQRVAVASTSFVRWETLIRRYIAPAIGERPVTRLTSTDVQRVRDRAISAGLAPVTVGQILGVLRMILRSAVRDGVTHRNVAEGVRAPDVPERATVEVGIPDLKRLLERCETHRLGPLIAAALGSGMRQGELLAVTRRSIDLKAGTIRVERSLRSVPRMVREPGAKRLQLGPTKTSTSVRTVAVSPFALRLLARHLETTPHRLDGLVFTSPTGAPFDRKDLIREFHAMLAELGLPTIRFHDLRALHATLLRELGVDRDVIRWQLGHGRDMTDRYVRVGPSLQHEAVLVLDAAIAG